MQSYEYFYRGDSIQFASVEWAIEEMVAVEQTKDSVVCMCVGERARMLWLADRIEKRERVVLDERQNAFNFFTELVTEKILA